MALVAAFFMVGLLAAEARAQLQPPPGPITNWVQLTDSVWGSRIRSNGDTVEALAIRSTMKTIPAPAVVGELEGAGMKEGC